MLKAGIVGTGVMGSIIAQALDGGASGAELVALNDLDSRRAETLAASLRSRPGVLPVSDLIGRSDLIVEAAAPDAVGRLLGQVIAAGKNLLVLSVGGLIDREEEILEAVRRGSHIYCPSGAIAGLDAVRAAAEGRIDGAAITTRKPPAGLAGAPFFRESGLDPLSLTEARVVFEGSAREACRLFPQNVNVSAALSLAGIGVDRTRVRIIADPEVRRNLHRVEVWGDFGRIETLTENVPSANPKTSHLAALSAIALIRRLSGAFQVGT
jgi:aspartate dehydrogenase